MTFRNNRGFTLGELALVVCVFLAVVTLVVVAGWGLAFTFAGNVIVPCLGVPAAWAHVAQLVLSLMLTGAGATVIAWLAIFLGFSLMAAIGLRR